jgi:hypothetical protein
VVSRDHPRVRCHTLLFALESKGKCPLMTHHGLASTIDGPSRIEWLDPVGDQLNAMSQALQRPRILGNVLRGTWMGSPQHPGIVWIPSGLGLAAGLLALRDDTHHAARSLVLAELASVPVAAATGLAEAASVRRRGRRIAAVHATLNTVASGMHVVALTRARNGRVSRPWLYAGLTTQMVAAMWGRHLAYNYRAELIAPLEPVIDVREDHERGQDHERPRDRGKSPHVM